MKQRHYSTASSRRAIRKNKIIFCVAFLCGMLTCKVLSCFHMVNSRVTWLDDDNGIVTVTCQGGAYDGHMYDFYCDTESYKLHHAVELIMFDNNTDDPTDDIILGDTH